MNHRDLTALKKRLEKKATGVAPVFAEELQELVNENDSLKQFIRDLYQDAISCDDARDFTIGVQESLATLIRSWGENPLNPEEYMEAQREAEEKAKDEAEFERLRRKLGKG